MLKTSIPFIDLRDKTPIDLLRSFPDKARDLLAASRQTYGWLSYFPSFVLYPMADRVSHAWLKRTQNPHLYEIESYAEILDLSGIYALNLSYEWGCTTGAYSIEDNVTMLRVLDWPIPKLGREVMVLLQKGRAGEYYNITWPALSGVFTAMAKGRFCAAINQAPSRMHKGNFIYDWIKNVRAFFSQSAIPAPHLLRQVFEQAESYDAAKRMLCETPIATPAIFTLTGISPGQGCIIERLEHSAEIRELGAAQQVSTANHFLTTLNNTGVGWCAREIDSIGRYKQSCTLHGYDLQNDHFENLRAPILNVNTRLCVVANAATGRLVVQGFEGISATTDVFTLQRGA